MATKDWKKVGINSWRNNKDKYIIEIEYDNITKKYIIIKAIGLAGSQRKNIKQFKTKSAALAYAKAYMRKH